MRCCIGITPAGAGKTLFVASFVEPEQGSPPQVRGKHAVRVARAFQAGITPAGAGKTDKRRSVQLPAEDHPRRCGENCKPSSQRPTKPGSPPQVRGKQLKRLTVKRRDGITPAGAGKTHTIAAPAKVM